MILVALGVAAMHLCSHYVVRHPQSGHPFVETAKDATLSEYTRDVPVSPTAWEETAEQMDMEILSPAYKVRVLRSILNHSNHTWQDMEGELQGYIIHTLLFMNIVGLKLGDRRACISEHSYSLNSGIWGATDEDL